MERRRGRQGQLRHRDREGAQVHEGGPVRGGRHWVAARQRVHQHHARHQNIIVTS